jgi:hypothetical protein
MNAPRDLGRLAATAAIGLWLAGVMASAAADGPRKPVPDDPTWREECGSCHVAYPPRMLPTESWRRVMAGLDQHFGVDASLDPAVAASIADFLNRNARQAGKAGAGSVPAPLRITEMSWFRREHREIAGAKWSDPAVRSAANCAACHRHAEQGKFGERDIVVP